VRRYGESAAVTIGCAVLAACSFPADYSGTRYQCEAAGGAGECPPGYACRAGFCEPGQAPGIDGGGGGMDAGDPADGPNAPPDAGAGACVRATAFSDDFDSGDAWDTFAVGGCAARFEIGRIRLSSSPGLSGACGARSSDLYLLDGLTWIEAVEPGQGSPEPEFGVTIGEEGLFFRRNENGLVLFVRDEEGDETPIEELPFSSSEHDFWGFRPDKVGGIAWETSPDAMKWSELGKFYPKESPSEVCMRYEIGMAGSNPTLPIIVSFDNLNLPGFGSGG
jgi:hypothetical protein